MNLLQRLLKRLDLRAIDQDTFIGGSGMGGVTNDSRLFGGLVAAQATMAAALTVDKVPMHSLHAYFLRPGRPDSDIEYRVSRAKQGKIFKVRNVAAWQNEELIFQLQTSFQKPEPSLHHQTEKPAAAVPNQCPNRDQLRGRSNWRDMPIDIRMVSEMTADQPLAPQQQIWIKANGELPADPNLHLALTVYASDRSLLDTAWRPHADQGDLVGASLDHSMWFHQPPIADEWLLYDMSSPAAAAGRGLAFGAMYDVAGTRVVSVAQEGVLRVRRN